MTKQALEPQLLTYLTDPVDLPREVQLYAPSFTDTPVAGVVSHHSLVAPVHHRWFEILRERRTVETFIIIAPRHFPQGTEKVSISTRPWNAGNGIVTVDVPVASDLLTVVNMAEDHSAFRFEHGIGALLPFIVQYFPDSRIVPIAVDPKDWSPTIVGALAKRISYLMSDRPGIMLIISVDFSHAGGQSVTSARDARSRLFVIRPSTSTFPASWSDNRPGLYCLGLVAEELGLSAGHVFCHTNSHEFSGRSPENITSYFFSFYTK